MCDIDKKLTFSPMAPYSTVELNRVRNNGLLTKNIKYYLNPRKLGFVESFMLIKLISQNSKSIKDYISFMDDQYEIRNCTRVNDSDFMIRIIALNYNHRELVVRKLSEHENTKSIQCMDVIKNVCVKNNVPIAY